MSPLAIDLFCGLGGWTDGLLAEGFYVVGFDIERHDYGTGGYPAQLVLQDVMTIHGRQFRDAALIVASPPCQEYSYMAMPWSLAKQKRAEYLDGRRDRKDLTALFDACFRIQREASEAAGHHIPLVVENVRGACEWVGRSRWNFGSFHLWGDVPALMPMALAIKNSGGSWFNIGSPGQKVTNQNPVHKLAKDRSEPVDQALLDRLHPGGGTKQSGSGREWFAGDGKISRVTSSHSKARKAASAAIAKIPFPLSQHIARYWKPTTSDTRGGL